MKARRILVCGSREWRDRGGIRATLAPLLPDDPSADEPTIIHGAARGADRLAGEVALELGFWVEVYPAKWDQYGKRAGILRNLEMLDNPLGVDLVVAFGRGKGTDHTVGEAERRGIPVWRVP